jgi:phosphoribosylamine--glycine ligase
MGAYSPLPDLDDAAVAEILEQIHRPLLAEMARRGTPFRGFLYAGLMLTAAGPALLECNVRLGDPEAQVVLPRVTTALGPLLLAGARGALPGGLEPLVPVLPGAAVGIVLAAEGYPGEPRRGDAISGLELADEQGALLFHAGTVARPGGGYGTNGGRVLTVVGRAGSLDAARAAAERAADVITWDGLQRRHDIARDRPEPALAVGAAGGGRR